MKHISRFSILVFTLLLATACTHKEEVQPIDKEQNLVMAATKCSKLYTVQYNVRKIVTFDDIKSISGSIFSEKFNITIPGDRKIAIPVDATIKGYIDFSNFTKENIHINGEEITITLPDPQMVMTSSKINHENMVEYNTLFRSKFSEKEKEDYLKQGIANIMANMKNTDIINRSRINAYNTLQPIAIAAGYKPENIHIYFRDEIEKNAHDDNTIFSMIRND